MSRGRLHAGTSGYAYKEWKGSFFPEKLRVDQYLSFYSSRLQSVEINNTFYRFPTEKVLAQWVEDTPDTFTFAIKANQRITHRNLIKNVAEVTASFVARCRTLDQRLGPILFQLPPKLARDDDRLRDFVAELPEGGKYAVEFRHASWFDDTVWSILENAGVGLVLSEDEKLATPRALTAGFCYVRLRRDDYDNERLLDWRDWIAGRRDEGHEVFVYLKHDESGTSPERSLNLVSGTSG